ncbi:XkdX family protein [Leuconostoc mesenteroides]|nr:XkdX family protein [Leuconostoc mesenteroides]
MFDSISELYKGGYFTIDNLKLFVDVDFITSDQYKDLTGSEYVKE